MKKLDKRNSYFASNFKTREEGEKDRYIEGYFAVFNQETELWQGVFEQIAPKAFDKSIKNNDIRCLFNHETGFVLGRVSARTLTLKVDDVGLWGSVKINVNDRQAMDVYERVARGDISGCSFGFTPLDESCTEDSDRQLWTVKEADTQEVSICAFPAYPQTEIQARQKDFCESTKIKLKQRKAELKLKLEEIC